MLFEDITPGPADPMFTLKKIADSDVSPQKVDLGVGIYRNEAGLYHELRAMKKAKMILDQKNIGHDYELTTGNPGFLKAATEIVFGEDNKLLETGKITSVQTISGTGANHLGALFLKRCNDFSGSAVYIGTPTWGNYEPLFRLVGFENIITYNYYDAENASVDFMTLLNTVNNSAPHSIFILQGCCHNPTGADLNPSQWQELSAALQKAQALPFLDIAYQGLGGASMQEDSYAIRLFSDLCLDFIVCQSFSKNFGLYGERCGVLHVVCQTLEIAHNVYDQLRCLIRWEFSSSPAFGSRLVNIISQDPALKNEWLSELSEMRNRLKSNRLELYKGLTYERKTPGNWESILKTNGLFCYLPLSTKQVQILRSKFHIYLPENGRINVAGLNPSNTELVVSAIDEVVRA